MNKKQFTEGAKTVGKGLLYGTSIIALGILTAMGSAYEVEQDKKDSESFMTVMNAITKSGMSDYYQKKVIEAIANKQLTEQQRVSTISICEGNMDEYYKYKTIMNIID